MKNSIKYFNFFYLLTCISTFNFTIASPIIHSYYNYKLLEYNSKYKSNTESINPQKDNNIVKKSPVLDPIKSTTELNNNKIKKSIIVNKNTGREDSNDNLIEEMGEIGLSKEHQIDDPSDNIFEFNISSIDHENIFLEYDLYGIESNIGVSKSINFHNSNGGYVVKLNNNWTTQRERLNPKIIKKGKNYIQFSVPSKAKFNYKVKNIRIKTEKSELSESIVLTDSVTLLKDNLVYIKGFFNKEDDSYVKINDQKINIYDQYFEENIKISKEDSIRGYLTFEIIRDSKVTSKHNIDLPNKVKTYDELFQIEKKEKNNSILINSDEKILNDQIKLLIPQNTFDIPTTLLLSKIRVIDLPPMESGMVNVTTEKKGYRITPYNEKLKNDITIAVPYDKELIPKELTINDIRTYYFDLETKHWKQLKFDSIDNINHLVYSKTSILSDYVNGIIQLPESPQNSAFIPTSISDIKNADPFSGIKTIAPPSLSQKGEAVITYPIEIPAGRNGMQPDVNLQYNSEGGSSWIGYGWTIPIPSIQLDTRWGVATFDPIIETEIYQLSGEQLIYPKEYLPHRHNLTAQGLYDTENPQKRLDEFNNNTKQFNTRVGNPQTKIERIGNSTTNYRWKVINSDGTINWFGGDENGIVSSSILKNSKGNIVHWALTKSIDSNGNNTKYYYEIDNLSNFSGENSNLNGGSQIYLKQINYTGFNNLDGLYSVNFNRSTGAQLRSDISINGRLGFKQIDSRKLLSIDIKYNNELVRTYGFDFSNGQFNKSLLNSISFKNATGEEFYNHRFDYYDDISLGKDVIGVIPIPSNPTSRYFSDPEVNTDNLTTFPNNNFILNKVGFSAEGTALGSSISSSWNAGGYLGIGIGKNPVNRKTTIGASFDLGGGKSHAFVALVDIDGDGLQDKLYRRNGQMYYRKHSINRASLNSNTHIVSSDNTTYSHTFSDYKPINNIGNIYLSKDENTTPIGFQFNFPGGTAGINWTKSKSTTNVYMTDANGDMLVDVVNNGVVYFNRLENGIPTFTPSSLGTPNLLISAKTGMTLPPEITQPIKDGVVYDLVKVWGYPLIDNPLEKGLSIKGKLSFTPKTPNSKVLATIEVINPLTSQNCRIFYKELNSLDKELDLNLILSNSTDFSNLPLGCTGLVFQHKSPFVERNIIYFRLHGDKEDELKLVDWDPKIAEIPINNETLITKDANGISFPENSSFKEAFILSSKKETYVQNTTNVNISWPSINIPVLTDDVTFEIHKVERNTEGDILSDNILFTKKVLYGSTSALSAPNNLSNISVNNSRITSFYFKVFSDSNVNWKLVDWKPKLTYTDSESSKLISLFPIADYSIYHKAFDASNFIKLKQSGTFYLDFTNFLTNLNLTNEKGKFMFVVKNLDGNLLGKRLITIENGSVFMDKRQMGLFNGDVNNINNFNKIRFEVGIYPLNSESNSLVRLLKNYLQCNIVTGILALNDNAVGDIVQTFNAKSYYSETSNFGPMHLNWGQFLYNPEKASTHTPIDSNGIRLIDNSINYSQEFNSDIKEEDIIPTIPENGFSSIEEMEAFYNNIKDDPRYNQVLVALTPKRELNSSNYFDEKWIGFKDDIFLSDTKMNVNWTFSNPNQNEENNDSTEEIFYQGEMKTGAYAIDKINKGEGKSWALGAFGFGKSGSEGKNTSLSDYFDINGDQYPDIITNSKSQLTKPIGGLQDPINNPLGNLNYVDSSNKGISGGGSQRLTSGNTTGDTKGTGKNSVSFHTKNGGNGSGIGINGSFSKGNGDEKEIWIDINGDGLPDKVYSNGQVKLNIGDNLNFLTTTWPGLILNQTENESIGAGLGVSLWGGSIEAGVSLSKTSAGSKVDLIDMNGDGLPDLVYSTDKGLNVKLNNGNKFGELINWRQNTDVKLNLSNNSSTVNSSVNASGTVCIIIPLIFVTIKPVCVSVTGNAGQSTNKTLKSISDFNGDGYPDFLESNNNQITVYPSAIGRTNLLKAVNTPLKGSFTIDFTVEGNTYEMPITKRVLSRVTVFDKSYIETPSPIYQKFYKYEKGYYDRREREFYGFETIKSIDLLPNSNISNYSEVDSKAYRTSISRFYNQNYYLKGLLKESYVIKGGYTNTSDPNYTSIPTNKIFQKNSNVYELRKIENNFVNLSTTLPLTFDQQGNEGRSTAVVLLKEENNFLYELTSSPIQTKQLFTYDKYARIIKVENKGDVAYTDDDYISEITYHDISTLINKNIISIPKSIIVKDANTSKILRSRNTENINDITGEIRTIKLNYTDSEGNDSNAISEMTYDQYGNLASITSPVNLNGQKKKITYTYDSILNTYLIKIFDGLYTSESTYDYKFGQILVSKDINSQLINYTYDKFRRLELVQSPNEIKSNKPYTIKFEYFPNYNQYSGKGLSCVSLNDFTPFSITKHFDIENPTNDIETYTFSDGLGRVVQAKKDIDLRDLYNLVSNESMSISGKIIYDQYGREIEQFHPSSEEKSCAINSKISSVTTLYSTKTTYDELDRVTQVTDPKGNNTNSIFTLGNDAFNRKQIKSTITTKQNDTNIITKEQFVNLDGNITSIKNVLGASTAIWTKYKYDAIGQLLQTIDNNQNIIQSTYDQLGRRVKLEHPDAGTSEFWYDAVGNLIKMQTPNLLKNNNFINYKYDQLNRLIAITYPPLINGMSITKNLNNVSYQYGSETTTVPNGKGKLIKQTDATGVQEFEYGALGELTKTTRTIVANNLPTRKFVTQYEYDSWNRLQKLTYPDKEEVTYDYDLGGNLNHIEGKLSNIVTEYVKRISYNLYEQRTAIQYGNNTISTYAFDPSLLLLQNMQVKQANNEIMLNNTYSYDKVGNITSLENSAAILSNKAGGSYSFNYSYDNLNRLITSTGSWLGYNGRLEIGDSNAQYNLTMSYDNLHNITQKKQTHSKNGLTVEENNYTNDYTYKIGKPHQINSISKGNNKGESETFSYDTNGNILKHVNTDADWSYFWDESNRLRSTVRDNQSLYHYIYDASGERILKAETSYKQLYENGLPVDGGITLNNYTTYPSAYISINSSGQFTKHYYEGSKRIISKVAGNASIFNTLQFGGIEETELKELQYNDVQIVANEVGIGELNQEALAAPGNPGDSSIASSIYYFHPDHLGSSSYISDGFGNAYQFFLNLPFGETMAEQKLSGSLDSPYKFNGKELDTETGLYYYGARYYNPRISNWLSVDPIALWNPVQETEHYVEGQHNGGVFNPQNLSVYSYTYQNPIVYIDPNGKQVKSPTIRGSNASIKDLAKAGETITQFFNGVYNSGKDALNGVVESAKMSWTITTGDQQEIHKLATGIVAQADSQGKYIASGKVLEDLQTPEGIGYVAGNVAILYATKKVAGKSFTKFTSPTIESLILSSSEIRTGSTKRGIQALNKKIGRGDLPYSMYDKPTQNNVNKIIKDVMSSKNRIDETNITQQGVQVIDYYNPKTKQGVRVIRSTGKFDTFINYNGKK